MDKTDWCVPEAYLGCCTEIVHTIGYINGTLASFLFLKAYDLVTQLTMATRCTNKKIRDCKKIATTPI